MHDTQILKLQVIKLIDNLPAEGLQLLTKFIAFLESKFISLYKGDTTQPDEPPQPVMPIALFEYPKPQQIEQAA